MVNYKKMVPPKKYKKGDRRLDDAGFNESQPNDEKLYNRSYKINPTDPELLRRNPRFEPTPDQQMFRNSRRGKIPRGT
jgi:hypothetical protein